MRYRRDMSVALPLDRDDLLAVLRPRGEAQPLPPAAYTDPDVLAWELEHLFEGGWACVGHAADAPGAGDAFPATVGGEPVVVVRGDDGIVRAFFNVCQHRGTRLIEGPSAGLSRIICPYHSWTYDLQGNLRAAERMTQAMGFLKAAAGLRRVPVEAMHGWLFVNVSGSARPWAEHMGNFPDLVARFDPARLVRAARTEYEVAANWKLLTENYQECYHCPSIHPELVRVTPPSSGSYETSRGAWIGGPMELKPGCTTMTLSGVTDRSPIPGLPAQDHALVYYYGLLPNLWVSLHPDYVLTHLVWPVAPDRTKVVCDWLFHPSTVQARGFDPGDAVEFWDTVNRQDWRACERVQEAIGSRGFGGGRFSDMEDGVHAVSALLAAAYLEGRIPRADELPIAVAGARALA